MYVSGSNLFSFLQNNTFELNVATDDGGACSFLFGNTGLVIAHSSFLSNSAGGEGQLTRS
jgi:hypothetical protein